MIKNIIYVEDGSVDLEELESTLTTETKIIVYRQGSTPPTLVQPKVPINDIFNEAEFTGNRNIIAPNAGGEGVEETAEYLYKHNYREQSETITFYKDPNIKDWAESEYAWCERPCDSNMSMRAIDKKGNIVGYASEHYWTWCDVKEVKKVSAREYMGHFASKQSETVKEFAEKALALCCKHHYSIATRNNQRGMGMFTEGFEQVLSETAAELAEQFGKEEK